MQVFLRAGQMALLDKLRTDVMNKSATVIQRFVRGYLARKAYRRIVDSVLLIQSATRAMFARRVVQGLRENKAALVIQKRWRGHRARKEYKEARYVLLMFSSYSSQGA